MNDNRTGEAAVLERHGRGIGVHDFGIGAGETYGEFGGQLVIDLDGGNRRYLAPQQVGSHSGARSHLEYVTH